MYDIKEITNQILHGDALTELKKFEDECIDMTLCSPPYWGLRAYQTNPQIWDADPNCDHDFKERKYILHSGRGDNQQKPGKYSEQEPIPDRPMQDSSCVKCQAWRGELGLEQNIGSYIDHLIQVFDEVHRVLKPAGSLWIVIGDTYSGSGGAGGDYNEGGMREGQPRYRQTEKPRDVPAKSLCLVPERLAIALVDRGWILRNIIIWYKGNPMPSSASDRFTNDYEFVLFLTKSQRYFFQTQYEEFKSDESKQRPNPNTVFGGNSKHEGYGTRIHSGKQWYPNAYGRIKRAVWKINTRPFSDAHFAVFPPALCETPIRAVCPEYICKACGKPRELVYEETRINTRLGDNLGSGKSGTEEDPNRNLHKSDWSKYRQQIIRQPLSLTGCHCGAGFRPGICLDPFMGSGTTALVALKNGRDFVGIELSQDYINIARKRLEPYINQTRLPV